MKINKITLILSLLLILNSFSLVLESVSAESALSIMQKNDAIPEGEVFRKDSVLLVIKSGTTEKKEFISQGKEYDENRRICIQFNYPSKIGFLIWDEPGEDSQQWIKLSSGKVRKLAGSEKGKPWMNSHFYNQDISRNYYEDFEYTLIGEEMVADRDCYQIKAVRIRGEKIYSHSLIYIGKEDYYKYRVEYFEEGLLTKTLDFSNYETIQGIPTPRKLTMARSDGRGKSILYIRNANYDIQIDDRTLTREAF